MTVLDDLTGSDGLALSTTSEVGEDGVARIVAVVTQGGVEIGTATWELTPDLSCTFGWEKAGENSPRLSFFRGWEK